MGRGIPVLIFRPAFRPIFKTLLVLFSGGTQRRTLCYYQNEEISITNAQEWNLHPSHLTDAMPLRHDVNLLYNSVYRN